jgi:photosystem II biogenesis protein Psp29
VNSVRTVSDTKRAFYSTHTRPINSIYRRVVDELMVEMHLLTVNAHFCDNPIYALGVVTTYDRFMQGYRPESDLHSIFQALCAAVGGDATQYRRDATQVQASLAGVSWDQLIQTEAGGLVGDALKAVMNNAKFKYSRLFGVGLYTLLEQIDAVAVKDKEQLALALDKLTTALHLSGDRLDKDLELYRGNLDKMVQAQQAIADSIAADRKRRDQREQDKANAAAVTDAAADSPIEVATASGNPDAANPDSAEKSQS